ncbi:MAG: type III pantothenate kinase [Verrucomicrobia bacterium]|nr:type III pantothenate kinase [Verrucomicrobiota bacterium]
MSAALPAHSPPVIGHPAPSPAILCIDIGNTHAHYGVVAKDSVHSAGVVPTRLLDHPADGILPRLSGLRTADDAPVAIAFCSVVPAATPIFLQAMAGYGLPVWQIGPEQRLGVSITYPQPAEIGQDRLANAAGAHALFGSPAVVIDLGTAVTFDIITRAGGYEGGIIAPGPAMMRDYLHERTAQLPFIDDSLKITSAIGKSTVEGMRIASVIGFPGMIQALLDAVLAELAGRGEPPPALVTAGGAAAAIDGRLRQKPVDSPDLTLLGLAAAWRLNNA